MCPPRAFGRYDTFGADVIARDARQCAAMSRARVVARARVDGSRVGGSTRAPVRRAHALGWGRRRGAWDPEDDADLDVLNDARAHGYCVYSHADWAHAYVSADGEHSYEATAFGAAPDELRAGTLYRIGPGLFERGGKEYAHMLDGDGMALPVSYTHLTLPTKA